MDNENQNDNELFEVYARIVLPPHLYGRRQKNPLSVVRHGTTVVELLDKDGKHVGYLRGIQGASMFTSDGDLMRVSIGVIADIGLAEDKY